MELPRVELGKFACKANVSPVTQPRNCTTEQVVRWLHVDDNEHWLELPITRKILVRRLLSVSIGSKNRTYHSRFWKSTRHPWNMRLHNNNLAVEPSAYPELDKYKFLLFGFESSLFMSNCKECPPAIKGGLTC